MSSSDLFNRTPLKVLRARSIALLGERLNSKSLLFTEKDSNGGTHLLRDYRGLAEWAQIDPLVIKGRIENAPDHFQQVLASWCQNPEVTVGHLLDGLAALDRFDVVDDVFELLLEDCRNAVAKGFTTQTIIGENCLTIQVNIFSEGMLLRPLF